MRPTKRRDLQTPHRARRIPADVRSVAIGRTLAVPLGAETVQVRTMPAVASVRFSLRTRDSSEAKRRQGYAAAAPETF